MSDKNRHTQLQKLCTGLKKKKTLTSYYQSMIRPRGELGDFAFGYHKFSHDVALSRYIRDTYARFMY